MLDSSGAIECVMPGPPPAVLDAFGLSPGPARPVQGVTANVGFIVGPPGEAAFVRCERDLSDEQIEHTHVLASELRRCGIPVPAHRATRSGAPFVRDAAGSWQVHEFVDGEPLVLGREQHLAAAMRCLALIHRVDGAVDAHAMEPGLFDGWVADGRDRLSESAAWARAAGLPPAAVTDAWRRFEQALAAIRPRLVASSRQPPLPAGLTHGDFHGGNLLFRDDAIVAVLDLDELAVRPRVFDVAVAVLSMARRRRADYRLGSSLVRLALGTYEAEAPLLTATERESMLEMMVLSKLPKTAELRALARFGGDVAGHVSTLVRGITALGRQANEISAALAVRSPGWSW